MKRHLLWENHTKEALVVKLTEVFRRIWIWILGQRDDVSISASADVIRPTPIPPPSLSINQETFNNPSGTISVSENLQSEQGNAVPYSDTISSRAVPPVNETDQSSEVEVKPPVTPAAVPDEILLLRERTMFQPFERGEGKFFRYIIWRHPGSSDHGYEDAARVNPDTGIAAIADGTTLGWHSDVVSDNLVRYFVTERFRLDQEKERKLWWDLTYRQWFFERRRHYNIVSSSEQQKIDRGGSSTFLALRMDNLGLYRLYLIGDCTLFWFSGDKMVTVEGATEFDSHPMSLTTTDLDSSRLLSARDERPIPGEWALIATDALAKYLTNQRPWDQHDGNYCEWVEQTFTAAHFKRFTERLKADSQLDGDDYTLVLLHFSGASSQAGIEVLKSECMHQSLPENQVTSDTSVSYEDTELVSSINPSPTILKPTESRDTNTFCEKKVENHPALEKASMSPTINPTFEPRPPNEITGPGK